MMWRLLITRSTVTVNGRQSDLQLSANSHCNELPIRAEGCSLDRGFERESVKEDRLPLVDEEAASILVNGHDESSIWAGAN